MSRIVAVIAFAAAMLNAADMRTGVYRGRAVTFENVNGLAVYQGDIILGDTADVEAAPAAVAQAKQRHSTTVVSTRSLWPGGKIPFTIDASLSSSLTDRINSAIDYWNTHTLIKLSPRAAETNYVRFTSSTSTVACSSSVGMIGGQQLVRLPDACQLGPIIHEIGHAVGLWHEQERADRNRYITVLYENIDKVYASNYDQVGAFGTDTGAYDFNSLMHYGAYDFSKDGVSPAMETVPGGIPIGQRDGLSYGDIDSVQRLYGAAPTRTTISSTPSGLKIFVDGTLVDDGTAYDWAAGSTHTIRAPFQGSDTTRYYFGSWSDGGAETHTITVSPDVTVYSANFVRQHKVTSEAVPRGGGTVTIVPSVADGFYNDRTNIQITASPASGYTFVQWSVTPNRSLTPKFHTVSAPVDVAATFSSGNVVTVNSEPVGRIVVVDGVRASTPISAVWAAGSTHQLDVDTTQPDFIHYRFEGWADGGAQSHSVTATGQIQTFTAKFTPQYSLALSYSSRYGRVAVSPATSDGFYDAGTQVQLTAQAAPGWVFAGWSDDLNGGNNPATLTMDDEKLVTANFGASLPAITAVSAASALPSAVSPGEIIAIYGSNLGPASGAGAQVSGGKLTTTLGGTQVLFDGTPAALTYASAIQVNAVVPYAVGSRAGTIVSVSYNSQTTAPVALNVIDSQPALFTADQSGKKGAAALDQNGSVNSPSSPAHRGEIVVLFATGEGETTPAGIDGQLANTVYPKPALPVSVRIGGLPAPVHYAGAAPGFVAGAMQINVQIPDGIRTGPNVPVQVIVGDNASPSGVTLAVE